MSPEPLAFPCTVALDVPSANDRTADADRLLRSLGRLFDADIIIPLGMLRTLPATIRSCNYTIDLVLGQSGGSLKVLDAGKRSVYGIALDLGTTSLSCSLFDLAKQEKVDSMEAVNPQTSEATDVLTRVQRSMTGDFELLRSLLMNGIGGLVREICSANGAGVDDVYGVVVSGNTVMTHFFAGLDVTNIPVRPHIPAVSHAIWASGEETGLPVNPNAVVYVFPNAGSYVGGDILSGMLCCGIYREQSPVLFVDVGTNAEVVLGCRDWLMAGAGAAGPALEDGVSSIGRKAEPGTISHVSIDPSSGDAAVSVIGGSEPHGICGSGMIDLIAELYAAGILDRSGKFDGNRGGVLEREGQKGFRVFTAGGRELVLLEGDVRNFLRSKAALFAFLSVFAESVGVRLKDIEKIYVAGALGGGINVDNAVSIGMLPDLPRERFISLGNSSLRGAEMLLCSRGLVPEVEEIRGLITYREMGDEPNFLTILQGGLFIPHTDPEVLKG